MTNESTNESLSSSMMMILKKCTSTDNLSSSVCAMKAQTLERMEFIARVLQERTHDQKLVPPDFIECNNAFPPNERALGRILHEEM